MQCRQMRRVALQQPIAARRGLLVDDVRLHEAARERRQEHEAVDAPVHDVPDAAVAD
jgi:hypothetical protein